MNGALRLRPAVAEDAAQLGEIALAAKRALGYSAELIEAWRPELLIDARTIQRQSAWVALCEERIAGFYSLSIEGRTARLEHLWVSPIWQRRGIGGLLMRQALRFAAEGGAGTFEVDAEPLAEGFYRRHGLSRVGEIAAPIPGDAKRVRPQMRCVLAVAARD